MNNLLFNWADFLIIGLLPVECSEISMKRELLSIVPIPMRVYIKEHDKHLLGDIVAIAGSWTAAHRAYPRSSQSTPYTADNKSFGRPSSRDSNKPTSQSEGNKTSDSAGNRGCYGCSKVRHPCWNCPLYPSEFQSSKGKSSENVEFV